MEYNIEVSRQPLDGPLNWGPLKSGFKTRELAATWLLGYSQGQFPNSASRQMSFVSHCRIVEVSRVVEMKNV